VKSERPEAFTIGAVRARVVRGAKDKGRRKEHARHDGRWYWRIVTKLDGKDVQLGVGWWTEDELRVQVAEHVRDRTPERKREERRAATTVELRTIQDLMETYIGDLEARIDAGEDIPRRTHLEYRRSANRWTERFGDTLLVATSSTTMAAFRDERLRAGIAPGTVRQEFEALGRAWRWALGRGYLDRVPPVAPQLRSKRVRTDYDPTDAEFAKTLAWMRDHDGSQFAPKSARRTADILEVQDLVGARIDEVCTLRVRDCLFERGRLQVDGKTGRRVIPMPDRARDILAAWCEDRHPEDLVWGISSARDHAFEILDAACAGAGVPKWTSHALRRRFVNRAEAAGVPLGRLATWLGHSPMTLFRSYRRLQPGELDDMAVSLGLVVPAENVESLAERRRRKVDP
jgi:integrase